MTITVAPARNEYTANAGQTIFNYTFKIFENTDLNVYVTPAGQECSDSDLITAYTVSGIGDPAGGLITLSTPTSDGDLVTIVSAIPSERTTDYQNNGDFRPITVNEDFDRVVSIVKKIEDKVSRAPSLPECYQGDKPLEIESPKQGNALIWDDTKKKYVNFVPASTVPQIPDNKIIGNFANYDFKTVGDVDLGLTSGGELVTLEEGNTIRTGGRITEGDKGGAFYKVVSGSFGVVDGGYIIQLSSGLRLQLQINDNLLNSEVYGLAADDDHTDFIEKALTLVDQINVNKNAKIRNAIDIPTGKTISFYGNEVSKAAGYTPNTDKSYFRFTGRKSYITGVSAPNIGADEFLISFDDSAEQCEEFGCSTGRGNAFLIKFQSIKNNNTSRTLEAEATAGNTYTEKTIKCQVDAAAGGVGEFRRIRYFPSYCKIKSIKVTDSNGSPDFYFELAMRAGAGFTYPFIRARDTSDIDTTLSIDWIYDSSDDILSFNVINYKATTTTFEIEISYTNEFFASLSAVWAYQSNLDFLRPHDYGSANRVEAIRSPEYRSYITGTGLDVRTATPARNIDDNYNLPNVTMPTPAGTRDTTQTTELKFYFRLAAGAALGAGATHALFRLYQSNRAIKCTVINGFLAQAPDWVPENHLGASFQPDIEIDWPIHTDRDNPQELLIPLDKKMMQRASAQAEQNDFEYYYLTFYDNLPGHSPIDWGDVWEWDFQFIRK